MSGLGPAPRLDGPDLGRMAVERMTRLRDQMQAQGVDGAVLLHGPHVTYATGHIPEAVDASHANHRRAVAVVGAADGTARLHAHDPVDDVAVACAEVGAPLWPELDDAAAAVGAAIAEVLGDVTGRRVAVDAVTGAMARAGVLDGAELVDASRVLGPARMVKTDDELACIDEAQRQTERAMDAAQAACVPGATRAEVAGAFLAALRDSDATSGATRDLAALRDGATSDLAALRDGATSDLAALRDGATSDLAALRDGATSDLAALRDGATSDLAALRDGATSDLAALRDGATSDLAALRDGATSDLAALRDGGATSGFDYRNGIDPIFQPMPAHRDGGPRTFTGHVAFPTGVDNPVFAEGDLVWVDAGVGFCGYMSDFGRTWVAGRDPNPAEQSLFDRWMAVLHASLTAVRPGATLGDVGRAARSVEPEETPWLPHFYLAHGLGLESAEMPMIGTDLGSAFDDGFELAAGMVLVFEPVIWADEVGGYRAEEIVAVTDAGWRPLGGGHHYKPFRS